MSNLSDAKKALITAETALEDAIERQDLLEKQHRQDISEIVHDIKNPLTAIIGYLRLIRGEVAGPMENETYARVFKTLDRSADRLLGICNSLLGEYSDAGAGKSPEEVVDVSDLVNEIRDLFAAKADEQGIKLTATIDKSVPKLRGDPQEMNIQRRLARGSIPHREKVHGRQWRGAEL